MALFDAPIHANDMTYERAVYQSGVPAVAVFWRRDCPPCEQLDLLLDRLARDYAGKLLVVKLNVEDAPKAAQREQVRHVPTLLLVKDGRVVQRGDGAPSEPTLREWVAYLVGERTTVPTQALHGASVPLRPTAQQAQPPRQPRSRPRSQTGAGNGKPVTLTDATFGEFVSSGVALVDFWAEWCGPCHMIAPAIETLAREYAGRVKVGKLNVDENPRTPMQFQIRGIPTLIIFRNGRPVDRIVGVQSLPALRQRLDAVLAGVR
nr:thioredoxin [Ardenticatena sp.]